MNIETIPVKIAGNPRFTTNCYFVSEAPESSSVLVIDPADEPDLLLELLGTRTVSVIIITHGHYDHIGRVGDFALATDAKVYCHKDDATGIVQEYEAIRKRYERFTTLLNSKRKGFAAIPFSSEPPTIAHALEEGEVLEFSGVTLEVFHTPGHSRGSLCLYGAEHDVLFSGDTLFRGTCGRIDFEGGSKEQMHDSLARLKTLPPQTKVYPGHEEPTTIGDELRRGLSEYEQI